MPLAYIAVRCDPCDTKRSMKAVSQSPQRNARFAKSVCNAGGPAAKIIFYFQPLIGILNNRTPYRQTIWVNGPCKKLNGHIAMAVRVNPISTIKTGFCIMIIEGLHLLFFGIFYKCVCYRFYYNVWSDRQGHFSPSPPQNRTCTSQCIRLLLFSL